MRNSTCAISPLALPDLPGCCPCRFPVKGGPEQAKRGFSISKVPLIGQRPTSSRGMATWPLAHAARHFRFRDEARPQGTRHLCRPMVALKHRTAMSTRPEANEAAILAPFLEEQRRRRWYGRSPLVRSEADAGDQLSRRRGAHHVGSAHKGLSENRISRGTKLPRPTQPRSGGAFSSHVHHSTPRRAAGRHRLALFLLRTDDADPRPAAQPRPY
jgi:hypothetical protein